MYEIALIIAGAFLNRGAGWGIEEGENPTSFKRIAVSVLGKATFGIIMGVLFFGYLLKIQPLSSAVIDAFIIGTGFITYRGMGGWGDYWDGSDTANDEVPLIDHIVPFKAGLLNDIVSMALRGWFGVMPMFVALAVNHENAWFIAWSLLGLLQGFVYHGWRIYLKPNEFDMQAQLTMGAIITAALLAAFTSCLPSDLGVALVTPFFA